MEALLASDGQIGALAHDPLGGDGIVEGVRRCEVAAMRDNSGPHAAAVVQELCEHGLNVC